jgi:hypothetical protein
MILHTRPVLAIGTLWLGTLFLAFLLLTGRTANAQVRYGDIALDAGKGVNEIAQHSSRRLYAFGDAFGVYRSDDFGAHWRFLLGSMTEWTPTIEGLDVSPTDADRVAFRSYKTVWTSGDGGATWNKILSDLKEIQPGWMKIMGDNKDILPPRGARQIAFHPQRKGELWLVGEREGQTGTLWRTTDDGAAWSAVGGPEFVNERAVTIFFQPDAPDEIWIGTAAVKKLSTTGGLWCSVDGGNAWRKVWDNGGARTKKYGEPYVSCIARNADRVSVFSGNNGIWQVTATNWNDPQTYVATQRALAEQNGLNVTSLSDGTFWASEVGKQLGAPLVSADGVTWTERPIRLIGAYVPEWTTAKQIAESNRIDGRRALVQDLANPARHLLAGADSPLLSDDAGATWRYQPGGMTGTASHGVHFDLANPNRAYLATSDHGIFIVNDGGMSGRTVASSQQAFGELQTYHETMASPDGQTIVAAGVQHGVNRTVIIRSTDAGSNWTKVTPSGLAANYDGVTRAVMSLNDPNDFLVLLGSRLEHVGEYHDTEKGQPNTPGLYRTTDGGQHFVQVGGTLFDGVDTGKRSHPQNAHLERDGLNPDVRYLALRSPALAASRGLWRSTDRGTSWRRRSDPVKGQAILTFAVDATVEGRLWAGCNQLRRSDDGGDTWTDVADFTGTTSVSCHAGRIAVLGQRKGDEFDKIYASADDGATWTEMTSPSNRMIWAKHVTVDPWRPGQIWVAGPRSFQIINPPAASDPTVSGTAVSLYLSQRTPKLSGLVGQPLRYAVPIAGHPIATFKIANGALPPGLRLGTYTGVISGTPTVAVSGYQLTVEGTNANGSVKASITLDIGFGPRLAVAAPEVYFQAPGTTGRALITLTNVGTEPLSWSAGPGGADWLGALGPSSEGTLAVGSSVELAAAVNTAGMAQGQSRTAELVFKSNDPVHPTITVPFHLTAGAPPAVPVIDPGQHPKTRNGATFSYAMRASNGPTAWRLTAGKLPDGVMLDLATGLLSGSPAEVGDFALQFTASNPGGTSQVESLAINISATPVGADYDFNMSHGHFEETFHHTPGWVWGANTGVGGTGGLGTDSNDRSVILPGSVVAFSTAGQSVEMGVAFQARNAPGTAGGDNLRLGLKPGGKLPLVKGDALLTGISKLTNEPLAVALIAHTTNSGSAVSTNDTDAIAMLDEHWYALRATITYDGANRFTIATNLYHLGRSGTEAPKLLDEYRVTRTDLTSLVDVPLFAGFRGMNTSGFGGVRAFDNFHVSATSVPTP